MRLWNKSPVKNLTYSLKSSGGRNSKGRITVNHRGGGHRKRTRLIDFDRSEHAPFPALVRRLEYDPGRNAVIALLCYKSGFLSYSLASTGLKPGDHVFSGDGVEMKRGNSAPLFCLLPGTFIHSFSFRP
jgi:large subunit ribosomal protein L2